MSYLGDTFLTQERKMKTTIFIVLMVSVCGKYQKT